MGAALQQSRRHVAYRAVLPRRGRLGSWGQPAPHTAAGDGPAASSCLCHGTRPTKRRAAAVTGVQPLCARTVRP